MLYQVGQQRIALHIEPLRILNHFTQRDPKQHEAGGIILGKLIGNEIQVIRLSVPTSLDNSSRHHFERHAVSAQIVLDYEFFNSNGEMIYLGEWHTHPEAHPTPSDTDRRMIQRQYRSKTRQTDGLLLFIQGTSSLFVGMQTAAEMLVATVVA